MSTDRNDQGTPGPAADPFGRLARELGELDYAAGEPVDGITTYAYTNGGGILASIDHTDHQEARLSHRNDDGDPTWTVRMTADTPAAVQLVMLYAVLYAGDRDEQAIVRTVAEALNVALDAA